MVPRPTSKVPESQDAPTLAHSGALIVELYTAVEPPLPPLATTVRLTVVTCDRLPDVPVTVTVADPVAAELPAVRVSVVEAAELAGLNDALTPVGRLEALNDTALVKPLDGVTVTVVLALAP